MSDKPILFSRPMVRAILEGHKTQTRRILKSQPGELDRVFQMGDGSWHVAASDGSHMSPVNVPYAIGDRLWVRETWVDGGDYYGVLHRADFIGVAVVCDVPVWKPSIHMPKLASRLTLIITDVRVQRVQDISEEDARTEGLSFLSKDGKLYKWGMADSDGWPGNDDDGWHWQDWEISPRLAFSKLWDSIYAKRGYGWDENPWVAALTFTIHKCNIKDAPHGTA